MAPRAWFAPGLSKSTKSRGIFKKGLGSVGPEMVKIITKSLARFVHLTAKPLQKKTPQFHPRNGKFMAFTDNGTCSRHGGQTIAALGILFHRANIAFGGPKGHCPAVQSTLQVHGYRCSTGAIASLTEPRHSQFRL